ncbi:MAG: redoxin family protein [Tannerella sp.]|jgi:thiol-disulfide isomerase/thioredoxin|nr:redoxin family protein [Tannerella sp.]
MKKFLTTILFSFLTVLSINLLAVTKEDPSDSEIVQLDYPESLGDVLLMFKGKVIYIDIMASWCKPCITELTHSKQLESFFLENDIVKLFISIDSPDDISKCLNILQEQNLNGYFLPYHNTEAKELNNSSFAKEIEPLFITFDENGNMTGMSIPQFIIIDKNGTIAELKAKRPGNPEALKNQLRKYF